MVAGSTPETSQFLAKWQKYVPDPGIECRPDLKKKLTYMFMKNLTYMVMNRQKSQHDLHGYEKHDLHVYLYTKIPGLINM